jgi:hypothetical protein
MNAYVPVGGSTDFIQARRLVEDSTFLRCGSRNDVHSPRFFTNTHDNPPLLQGIRYGEIVHGYVQDVYPYPRLLKVGNFRS